MTIEQSISQWTKTPFDQVTIAEVEALKQNPIALEDAFYKEIEFGTSRTISMCLVSLQKRIALKSKY